MEGVMENSDIYHGIVLQAVDTGGRFVPARSSRNALAHAHALEPAGAAYTPGEPAVLIMLCFKRNISGSFCALKYEVF